MPAPRLFPQRTLEQALRVPTALKEKNGGNPYPSADVATALGIGAKSGNFFYLTASSRDYGLTEGTRDTAEISLTDLGRRAVYPATADAEHAAKVEAFLRVDVFKKVLAHFGGNALPERKYLTNTLTTTIGLPEDQHDEFLDLFNKNCRYLGIGERFTPAAAGTTTVGAVDTPESGSVTVAVPSGDGADAPTCFVIMPFSEREDSHQTGFFDEALARLFVPAGTNAGFRVTTARRLGSDIIQQTIVRDLLSADLVLADLTEHNPNVLFELGMRMALDKPVVLVRAKGTGPIFDVDNVLRVEEYSPNLWTSTVEQDLPRIEAHIKGTWDNRQTGTSYMRLLGGEAFTEHQSPPA